MTPTPAVVITPDIDTESVAAFLRSYIAAFNACDGATIAAHYTDASLSLRGDGAPSLLSTREQAEPFFASVPSTCAGQGCVDWRADNVTVDRIGSRSAVVTD